MASGVIECGISTGCGGTVETARQSFEKGQSVDRKTDQVMRQLAWCFAKQAKISRRGQSTTVMQHSVKG